MADSNFVHFWERWDDIENNFGDLATFTKMKKMQDGKKSLTLKSQSILDMDFPVVIYTFIVTAHTLKFIFLRRPQKFVQLSSWFWRLLSKFQNHKADCAHFCGFLRKAELYIWISRLKFSYGLAFIQPIKQSCTYTVVTTTQIQIARPNWKGFFSNISHLSDDDLTNSNSY